MEMAEGRQVLDFSIDKRNPLGCGAYGTVYKAKYYQSPCAAKILHSPILYPTDPGAERVMQRFQQECSILGSIRHPNIVQYLDLCTDPESGQPALLMELMDESLKKMLGGLQGPLAYSVEVNICHDIALAVAYLHSTKIIHRDLSSNNVLINAKRQAKLTDFGMSRVAGAAPNKTPLTRCPGTEAYMPPEALKQHPSYTEKLDCFSEGVLMIQVCTRLWPMPGPCFTMETITDSGFPTSRVMQLVPEPERRKDHINLMIQRSHPLLPIALHCLQNDERERPSSKELCQRLAALKESTCYRESVQQVEREQNNIAMLKTQIGVLQQTNQSLQRQVEQLQNQLMQQAQSTIMKSTQPSPLYYTSGLAGQPLLYTRGVRKVWFHSYT